MLYWQVYCFSPTVAFDVLVLLWVSLWNVLRAGLTTINCMSWFDFVKLYLSFHHIIIVHIHYISIVISNLSICYYFIAHDFTFVILQHVKIGSIYNIWHDFRQALGAWKHIHIRQPMIDIIANRNMLIQMFAINSDQLWLSQI